MGEDYQPSQEGGFSRNRSSWGAEHFHTDTSLEAVDRRAPNKSKNCQWLTEDELRFNLWDHDGRIRVRCYAGERCFPKCVIERHSGLTPGVMVWGSISYHGRPNLLRIRPDNAHPHVAKTVRDFCSAQHMSLVPWPAHSLDMPPIEHVWDLVDRRLARDPRPAASKDKLLLAHTSNMEFLFTNRHSNSVGFHTTPYISINCNAYSVYTKY
ncbi:transposable element Tcb2 transposase [Trichonephila clavipes]|nr:transposable element Tcb2 transposase [Trichonephila clavipes]